MKKKAFFLLLLFFLQFSFMPFILLDIKINLLLLFTSVLILINERNFITVLPWVLSGGILFDIFSAATFGVGILSFIFSGLVLFIFLKMISSSNNIFSSLFLLLTAKSVFDFSFFLINKLQALIKGWDYQERFLLSVNYLIETVIFILLSFFVLKYLLRKRQHQLNEIKIS